MSISVLIYSIFRGILLNCDTWQIQVVGIGYTLASLADHIRNRYTHKRELAPGQTSLFCVFEIESTKAPEDVKKSVRQPREPINNASTLLAQSLRPLQIGTER